jgi:ankyrin repeat protein
VKEPPHGRGEILSRDGDVGATPFWLAARAAEADIMQALAAGGADPNLGAADNTTPLMAATGLSQNIAARVRTISESQFLEAVKVAVELGADVNAANDRGKTALHGAAGVGESTIIQFLADKGGNVDAEDEEGQTPLTVAERGGSYQESRKKGADLLRTLSGDAGSAAR